MSNNIAKAIAEQPQPPCDRGCAWRAYCSATGEACPAFYAYAYGASRQRVDELPRKPCPGVTEDLWNPPVQLSQRAGDATTGAPA